jgi:hypothetical protein
MRKLSKAILAACIMGSSLNLWAADPWVNVYYNNQSSFTQRAMADLEAINVNADGLVIMGNDGSQVSISCDNIDHWTIGNGTIGLYVTTDDYCTEVTSKEEYLTGTLSRVGVGIVDDIEDQAAKIRGRGNTTWGKPKKPYRIKFDKKTRLGDDQFRKAKNWVLLANYIDNSMMRTEAAMLLAQIVGLPGANHCLPVDFYFNGIYKGSYTLTEKVGINNGSISDIEDETQAALYELDTYTADADEHPFTSAMTSIPVRIKDPDAPEDDPDSLATWEQLRQDAFNAFEKAAYSGDEATIFEACDLESLVRFVMTFNIACNQEIDHPKSIYMYKRELDGKMYFGPAWDFDWAYGYSPTFSKGSSTSTDPWGWGGGPGGWNQNTTTYETYENPLLGTGSKNEGHGGELFMALCNNETFLKRYAEVWNDFYQNHLDEFWEKFDAYADALEPSANMNGAKNIPAETSARQFRTDVQTLRTWVANRIEYINSADNNYGLWDD